MDNQHRKISGYRELSQEEIDMMNELKELGGKIGALVEKLESNPDIDTRWMEAGKMDIQVGIMKLVRSIARPTTF